MKIDIFILKKYFFMRKIIVYFFIFICVYMFFICFYYVNLLIFNEMIFFDFYVKFKGNVMNFTKFK